MEEKKALVVLMKVLVALLNDWELSMRSKTEFDRELIENSIEELRELIKKLNRKV